MEATQLHFVQGRWTFTGRKSLYGSSEIHDHIMLIPKEESGRKAHLPSSRFNGNGAFRKGIEYVIALREMASLKKRALVLPGYFKLLYFVHYLGCIDYQHQRKSSIKNAHRLNMLTKRMHSKCHAYMLN